MKFKKVISGLLACTMIFSLAACGNSEKQVNKENGKGTMVVACSSAPIHYNRNANSLAGGYPAINIFSSLLQLTISGKIIPDLAETYEISEDGLTYTFHLHDNVKWHDGEQFTSADVKYTFETIIKEKGMNVEKYVNINEILTPDDKTVIFKLNEIDASLLSYLPQTIILPKHLYENTDWLTNPANTTPVGTGPFKFVSEEKDVSIVLEANKDYFMGEPGLDRIIYKILPDESTAVQAYLNNEVDLLGLPAAISPSAVTSLEKTPDTNVQLMISADRQYMVTNLSKEPWNDVRVRKAVAMCIDRPQLVEKAHKGYAEVAEGFYTPAVSWAYTDKYKMPERDIEAAKKLLDEAGYLPDANGVRIKDANIVIFEFAVFSEIATIIKQNLSEIGIQAKITTLENAGWQDKMKAGEFDIGIIGGYHGPDPDNMVGRVGVGGWGNFMKYNNPELEELFVEGRKEPELEKRKVIYEDMQRIISEDLPVMHLTEWCYIIVTRTNLKGHPVEMQDKVASANYFYMHYEN